MNKTHGKLVAIHNGIITHEYGEIGTTAGFCDINGKNLCVGDIVAIWRKDGVTGKWVFVGKTPIVFYPDTQTYGVFGLGDLAFTDGFYNILFKIERKKHWHAVKDNTNINTLTYIKRWEQWLRNAKL